MTESQAKTFLRRMLRFFTPGSVLHLLSELLGESADKARQKGDTTRSDQLKSSESALFVVGLGIDAACPR